MHAGHSLCALTPSCLVYQLFFLPTTPHCVQHATCAGCSFHSTGPDLARSRLTCSMSKPMRRTSWVLSNSSLGWGTVVNSSLRAHTDSGYRRQSVSKNSCDLCSYGADPYRKNSSGLCSYGADPYRKNSAGLCSYGVSRVAWRGVAWRCVACVIFGMVLCVRVYGVAPIGTEKILMACAVMAPIGTEKIVMACVVMAPV